MKKLVISALAASMASATALASESEWASLDRDVQALSASLAGLEDTATTFSGYIRTAYTTSGDIQVAPSGNDLGDFGVLQARLRAAGTHHGIGYALQAGYQNSGTGALLEDAYLDVPIGSSLHVRAGQFRALVARDALISARRLFFVNRSAIGELFEGRAQGVALMGEFQGFDWAVTVQDGGDGAGDDYLLALRGEIDLLGDGIDMIEGAYGAGDVEATAAVSYWDDGAVDDSNGLLFQATLASHMYSINAYVADLGEGTITGNPGTQGVLPGIGAGTPLIGDSTPFGVSGTFMIAQPTDSQGGWEVGARFQDFDDGAADTTLIDLAVNYYGAGHDYKYYLQYSTVDSTPADIDVIVFGVQLGW